MKALEMFKIPDDLINSGLKKSFRILGLISYPLQ